MLRDILSGARGMSPVVLVVLIAWALLSVMFLTGTLLAARSIDRAVTDKGAINENVQTIGGDAKFIGETAKIEKTSGQILTAAKPLSGQLDVIEEVARKGIDPRLKSILGQVGEINQVAGEINGTVLQIGSTVDGIFGNASSINKSVKSIGRRGGTILNSAQSINGSAKGILSSGSSILSRVNSIDRAVATIVGQANTILDVAPGIGTDLHTVLGIVGGGPGVHGSTIHGHANGIDCGTLLNGNILGLPVTVTNLLGPLIQTLQGNPAPNIYCNK